MSIILESTIVKTSTSKAHLTFIKTQQVNKLADLNEFNTLLAEKKAIKDVIADWKQYMGSDNDFRNGEISPKGTGRTFHSTLTLIGQLTVM